MASANRIKKLAQKASILSSNETGTLVIGRAPGCRTAREFFEVGNILAQDARSKRAAHYDANFLAACGIAAF